MEKNYLMKEFFKFTAYENLNDTIGAATKDADPAVAADAQEDLEFLRKQVNACLEYVHAVDSAEARIKMARFRYEGEEFRDIVQTLDWTRRNLHEAAITAVNIMNRLAALYECEKLFVGDTSDRLQVADFCLEVVWELFEHRQR